MFSFLCLTDWGGSYLLSFLFACSSKWETRVRVRVPTLVLLLSLNFSFLSFLFFSDLIPIGMRMC